MIINSSIKYALLSIATASLCLSETPPMPSSDSPTPVIDSYVLNLPDGEKMEFVFVKVSEDSNIFASHQFRMGESLNVGYRYNQTTATVGGSMYYINKKDPDAKPYWAIPMAKTELTRGQYAAIMGEEKPEKPNHPKTQLTKAEMIIFIEKFNLWLHTKNAGASAPAITMLKECANPVNKIILHGRIHARLPNEAEWEFAARGGLNVNSSAFRQTQPYKSTDELEESEVVARLSQDSSSEVGSTQKTNPCGLYDMLGNVSEVVENSFCPEYYYGRVGGILLRGGNWTTDLPDPNYIAELSRISLEENSEPEAVRSWVSSYYRQEAPILQNGQPFKSETMGFRLVIGSEIVSTRLSSIIPRDKAYISSQNHSKRSPGASPTDSLNYSLAKSNKDISMQLSMLNAELNDLKKSQVNADAISQELATKDMTLKEKDEHIAKLTRQLAQRNEQISILQAHIQPIEKRLQDNEAFKTEAQETMTKAGAELLLGASFFAMQCIEEIYKYERAITADLGFSQEEIKELKKKQAALMADVNRDWMRFENGCAALAKMDENIVAEEFSRREAIINKMGSQADSLSFELARKIYTIYKRKGSISNDDRDQWLQGLTEIVVESHKSMGQ